MSVADRGSQAPSLRRLPFTIRLSPNLVNELIAQREKSSLPDEISGLLFGQVEEGLVIAQTLRKLDPPTFTSQLTNSSGQKNLLERHLLEARKQAGGSALSLIGWYSIRARGGLAPGDVDYHDRHFPQLQDMGLIVTADGPLGVLFEVYCRTAEGTLAQGGHRIGIVRLSTSTLESAVEVMPRPKMQDDLFLRAYAPEDGEEEQAPGWKAAFSGRSWNVFSWLGTKPKPETPPQQRPETSARQDSPREQAFIGAQTPIGPPTGPWKNAPAPVSSDLGQALVPPSTPRLAESGKSPEQTGERAGEPPASVDAAKELPLRSFGQITRANSVATASIGPSAPVPGLINPAVVKYARAVSEDPGKRQTRIPVLAAVLLTAALTLGVVYSVRTGGFSRLLPGVASVSGLGMRVDAQGDRFLISWNRQDPSVRNAKSGTLEIQDGEKKREVALDASQIANGLVLYHPNSDDVTFRLEVHRADGHNVVDSVRVLDGSKTASANGLPSTPKSNVPEEGLRTQTARAKEPPSVQRPRLNVDAVIDNAAAKPAYPERRPTDTGALQAGLQSGKPTSAKQDDVLAILEEAPAKSVTGADQIATKPAVPLEIPAPQPATPSSGGTTQQAAAPSSGGTTQQAATPSNGGATPQPARPSSAGTTPQSATPSSGGTTQQAATPSNGGATPQSAGPSSAGTTPQPARPSSAGTAALKKEPESIQRDVVAPQSRATPPGNSPNLATYQPPRPMRQVLPNISSLPPGLAAQTGHLEILVKVDTTGRVSDARAVTGEARINRALLASALVAARQWRFAPAMLRGQPVESQHSIVFQFSDGR